MMKGKLLTVAILTVSVLLVSVLSLAHIGKSAPEPVKVYVDPPTVVDPSVLFYVAVKIDNIDPSPGLAGIEFLLTWNSTLLDAINMTEVMFHEVTPEPEWDNIWRVRHRIDNSAGTLYYAYTFQDMERAINGSYFPISGNHTLAIIAFQVKETGSCALHFEVLFIGDPSGNPIPQGQESTDGLFSNSVPPSPLPPPPPSPSEVLFYVSPRRVVDVNLVPNSTFYVAVKLDSVAVHHGIISVEFVLTWNSTLLDAVNMTEVMFHEVTPQNESSNIYSIEHSINNTSGSLHYWYSFMDMQVAVSGGYAPLFGNHTVAVVAFKVKDVGKCALRLTGCYIMDLNANAMSLSSIDGVFRNTILGDLNGDSVVDINDAITVADAYGSASIDANWNAEADMNSDNLVDIIDAILLANNFGRRM